MVTVMKGLRTPWGYDGGGGSEHSGGGKKESDGEEDGRVRN